MVSGKRKGRKPKHFEDFISPQMRVKIPDGANLGPYKEFEIGKLLTFYIGWLVGLTIANHCQPALESMILTSFLR